MYRPTGCLSYFLWNSTLSQGKVFLAHDQLHSPAAFLPTVIGQADVWALWMVWMLWREENPRPCQESNPKCTVVQSVA